MGMDGAVGPDGLKTAIVASDDALESARFHLARSQPRLSAHRVFHFTQLAVMAALFAAFIWAARAAPQITFVGLHITALAIFSMAIFVRSVAAGPFSPLLFRLATPARYPTYTILCPLYREANVAPDLIAALAKIDYPIEALDVKLLVESDDQETIAAARLASRGMPHVEVIIVPACVPRTKPKALNVGLGQARGEFVVVYDAEDRPHPQQLSAALAAFEDGGDDLACVQAPLEIDNADVSWISGQFAAEYAIQFREVLPLLAHFNLPLPLGGTSNHFRTSVLRQSGGWDAFNVREKISAFAS